MYQYYMGLRSNLQTKRPEAPIVVKFDEISRMEFTSYLDKHSIDFDDLAKAFKKVVNSELIEVYKKEEKYKYGLKFENGLEFVFEWSRDDKKYSYMEFFLINEDIIITCNLTYDKIIDRILKKIGDYSYIIIYGPLAQYIEFYKNNIWFAEVRFEGEDLEIFDKISENFNKFSHENMVDFFTWFKALINPKVINMIIQLNYAQNRIKEKMEIYRGEVKCYSREGINNEYFRCESSGDWLARVKNIQAVYDAKSKKHNFEIIEKRYAAFDMGIIIDEINSEIANVDMDLHELIRINKNE